MKHLHVLFALTFLVWGCTDETTPDDTQPEDASPPTADSRPESFIWDSGNGGTGGTSGDADAAVRPEVDAEVARCFREGAELLEEYVGDPVAGLQGLRVDVDYDGDGTNEIVLQRVDPAGVHFDFLSTADMTVLASVSLPGAVNGHLMPGLEGSRAQVTARTMAGQTVFVFTGERATGETTLHVHNVESGAETGQVDLGLAVRRIQLFQAGATWHALIDRGDGTCSAYRLPAATLGETWESCRLHPGWDLNGDTLKDIVRTGNTGFVVLDGQILEQIAQHAETSPIAVGFGVDGPKNYRGAGPEVVTASIAMGGDLVIRYHDPLELTPRTEGETVPLNGVFVKARFLEVDGATRLVGEYHRVELKLLGLLEITDGLRRLGEYGSVTVLDWSIEADADGNGVEDLRIMAGAREGGFQTAIEYADLGNGMIVHTIPDERSARFDPIWNTTDPPTGADIDGCEGIDYLSLRSSPRRADGKRATRLVVRSNGRDRYRGETYDGLVHEAALIDLDDDSRPEVVEIRSEDDDSARLRILRVGAPAED